MKFENTEVWGFEHALRGMRNPKESWDKSDSFDCEHSAGRLNGCEVCPINKTCLKFKERFIVGKNDLKLAQTLIKAGSEHRKFMRQIFVSVDITAPLYWWKEFDTYKVGTVANSTSTMHKLASTPITRDCFEMDDYSDVRFEEDDDAYGILNEQWDRIIYTCELLREKYNETKDKRYWKELIRLLPESWLQTRTVTMNYENILNMIKYRTNHKLTEWSKSFMDWTKSLPYADEFLFLE